MSYINTFYQKHNPHSQEIYQDDPNKTIYKGYEIHERRATEYHIVKDGLCIGMMAGWTGAVERIDKIIEESTKSVLKGNESGTKES